jgi:histidinol-phosphatase
VSHAAELAFAEEAARAAGALALERFRGSVGARRKADGTWVTEADEAAERSLREAIAGRFPEHNVHGEEEGRLGADGGPPVAGAPTWILDPIDGTHNYVDGVPIWATLVALAVDGEPVVGVVEAPALGETYAAARGLGARLNGEPIRAQPAPPLEDALVLFGAFADFLPEHEAFLLRLVRAAGRDRGPGDFWGHMLVARGSADAMVDAARLALWDVAALRPIVAEAGALLTALDGSPWVPGGPALCAAAPLHGEIAALAR